MTRPARDSEHPESHASSHRWACAGSGSPGQVTPEYGSGSVRGLVFGLGLGLGLELVLELGLGFGQ